jgi:hypothetical protein
MAARTLVLKINVLATACAFIGLSMTQALRAEKARTNDRLPEKNTGVDAGVLWQEPADIASRDLFYGPGGVDKQPGKVLTFVKEDLKGSNPKFVAKDENGVKWKVKLGNEAQPETAASRIVWAAGYNSDTEYLIPVLRVQGLPGHLSRGSNLIQPDGTVLNARLKREGDKKKIGNWSWRDAPFKGTREFDGLRVLMALIDNWDLKDENNEVYDREGKRYYEVSDLGASFGTTGALLNKGKAKGDLAEFESAKFVSKVRNYRVSFGTPSLPSLPYVFSVWDYERRARLRWIGRDINRADAKWIGTLLARLSQRQIADAFRAAAYSPADIEGFTKVLQERISELTSL